MSLDELNAAVARSASGGGIWVDLKDKGDRIEGTIVDFQERPRMFEGQPVLTRETKQPRFEWVFTLQTGESDGANDDGIRKVALDEKGQEEVKRVLREAGRPAEIGGLLTLGIVADRTKPNEMRHTHLKSRYKAPALPVPTDGLDDF